MLEAKHPFDLSNGGGAVQRPWKVAAHSSDIHEQYGPESLYPVSPQL